MSLATEIQADAARLAAAVDSVEAIPTAVAAGLTRSSTTSVTPGTGSKAFTFTAESAYTPWGVGNRVRAASAAAPTTKWMSGVVTAESSTALTMTVDDYTGAAAADWTLALSGEKGATGAEGPEGPMPDLASPGPIGGTTPAAGAFTTLAVGGHNIVPGGLIATVGTFSTGGNFTTGGTVSTGGTFTTVGNFTAGGAFTTSHAFTTTGGALTLTVTGTTNVTLPTSGTLATTAQIPTLSTDAQSVTGTSTAVATTPASCEAANLHPNIHYSFSAAQFSAITPVGSGAGSDSNDFGIECSAPTTAVGYGGRRNAPSNKVSICRGKGKGVIDWSKRVVLSFTAFVSASDSNNVVRFIFGKTSGDGVADLVAGRRAIGIKRTGTGPVELHVCNGTAVTTSSNSSFTPTSGQAFDCKIISDGAGACSLWINDTQVASCSGGPTTDGSSTENAIQGESENVGVTSAQVVATFANFVLKLGR